MQILEQERSRSMVEMLGVLAIIGVLSIGGIAGYTMAMNRYRANEIIDTASKLSVLAQTIGANGTSDISSLTMSSIGLPETAVHKATLNVCKSGKVTAKLTDSTGVQNALSSIVGKNYVAATGIVVADGSGAADAAADCKELPAAAKP